MTTETPPAELRGALRRALVGATALAGAVLLGLLALSHTELGREAFEGLVARTDPGGLVASLVVMSAGMLFVAMRWRALIPGRRLPPLGLTAIACSALVVNYALPGPVGELAAAGLVQRRYRVPAATALAAGLYGRFIGLGIGGLGTGAIWLSGTLPVPPEAERLVGVTALLIALGASAGAALALRPQWLRRISAATLGRLAGGEGRLGRWSARLEGAVDALVDALAQIGRLPPRAWAEAVLWALCGHTTVATGIWIGAMAIGATPVWGGVLFTYLASAAAVVALFAIPGAQLGWDALFLGFLTATAGVSPADALAITALQRLQQILLLFIGAAALAALITRRPE